MNQIISAGVFLALMTGSPRAQEQPYTQPGTAQPPPAPAKADPASADPTATAGKPSPAGSLSRFFQAELPEAIANSRISIQSRLRWEFADHNSIVPAADLKESDAMTLRTRFGLTTAPWHGFQGMIEGENISILGPSHNYNASGSNPGGAGKTAVADPPATEVNQAWLSYTYTNWLMLKGGRQRLVLDNYRFIGDVGWRQNMQTYDGATLESRPLEGLSLFYGYLWDVHRVFGDVDGLADSFRDFDSDSHLVNVSYGFGQLGRLVGYTYLLDLENRAGTANSCATYGGYFAGSAAVTPQLTLGYRAEAAWQTDYADSAEAYQAEYYNVELGLNVPPFAFGAGYEGLGTGSNDGAGPARVGFRTPLATLHAFNGWADVFLNTPAQGLRDFYAFAQVVLPWAVPIRFVYHKFSADSGGADFGQELDAQISKSFGRHWTVLAKYAYYDGKDAAAPALAAAPAPAGTPIDAHKFWLQIEFNF